MVQPPAFSEDPIAVSGSRSRRALPIIAALTVLHVVAIWGYAGLPWTDHGRWLHEVARFAAGEVPYRDFSWPAPPLALWLVGGAARLTGSGLAAITVTTTLLFFLIVASFVALLRRLTPDLVLPIALPALLFAMAYAHRGGAPLPLGTATPAAPLGFLCLLGAAGCMLTAYERMAMRSAVLAGILAGLAMLSRNDYWLTCLYLLGAGTALLARRRAARPLLLAPLLGCAATVTLGLLVAAIPAGAAPIAEMLAQSVRGLTLDLLSPPGLERLAVNVATTAALGLTGVTALWLCLAISDRAAKLWAGSLLCLFLTAGAVHVGMSVAIGRSLVAHGPPPLPTMIEEGLWAGLRVGRTVTASAVALFDDRFRAHLFPMLLPPILLAVLVVRWRRWRDRILANRLALLLGMCVVARAPRMATGPDWVNVLLELPCYALFLSLLCDGAEIKAARAVRAALSVLILLGLYTYVSLTAGPFTLTGSYPAWHTPVGVVHWPAPYAEGWARADSLVREVDPSGRWPLFAFGAGGGWNYYLRRGNPLRLTGSLAAAGSAAVEDAFKRVREAGPVILLETRFAPRPLAARAGSMWRWEPVTEVNARANAVRQDYLALRSTCREAGADTTQLVRVFGCVRRPVAPDNGGVRRPGSSR